MIASESHPSDTPWTDSLSELRSLGAPHYQPAQFHYVQTLAQHLQTRQGQVRHLLEGKVQRAVTQLKDQTQRAARNTQQTIDSAVNRHPQAAVELQHLLEQGQIDAVNRRIRALDNAEQLAPLQELRAYVANQAVDTNPAGSPATSRPELKTVRQFRSTWSKFSVDQLLSKDLEQAPKNAGPINSHMLTLRALELMRDISPDYLNRFVSYVDTLLYLEQSEQDRLLTNPKTSATAKKPRKKSGG